MEDEAALVAAFMAATGCGHEDAFDRLASCGGHLGRAVNSFFCMDAGPSGSRRSLPPPSPQVSVSESSSSEEDAVRAPAVPARRTRVSRWDSETSVRRSRSSRRRQRRRDRFRETGTGTTPGGDSRQEDGNRSRRRRRFREDIFSDGEEDEESNNSRRRRRLNPSETDLTSEGDRKADDSNSRHRFREEIVVSSSSDDDVDDDDSRHRFSEIVVSSDDDDDCDNNMLEELEEEAARPAPPARNNRTFEELFKVPRELTFKGGFHAAKVHAARRARWLLANVQSFALPLPSLHQNRDVWGNDLVARCVMDRFVLWQADADAADDGGGGGEGEEAKKVLGYYNVPHDMLPVVVVVDPVTGQAMDVLHGSAACELNDFMVRLGPYTVTKPTIIPAMAKNKPTGSAPAGAQSNTRPATTPTTTTAPIPTSPERAAGSRQQAPTTVMRKPPDAVVAAVAAAVPTTCQTRQEQTPTTVTDEPAVGMVAPCTGQQPEGASAVEEKVCKVRVRLADGRAVTKEFGSQCAVAALFAYCRSVLQGQGAGGGGGGAPPPFRLLRFVGRSTEEIGDQNASFESLGLHLTTVSVQLG